MNVPLSEDTVEQMALQELQPLGWEVAFGPDIAPDGKQPVRQLVSLAVSGQDVVDVFRAAGLGKPDISILSDKFLAEVQGLPQKNLAIETLKKLPQDEIPVRLRKNVVQSRTFSEMLQQALTKYHNRAIEASQVIEELISIAKEMREAQRRGEQLGLSDDEAAFYDALSSNDSAVEVLGHEPLKEIAGIFEAYKEKYFPKEQETSLDEAFCQFFDVQQMPETLNDTHKLIIVAANLDPSTEWIKTVPISEAIREKGLFGNQNIVAQPRSKIWPQTIERLKARFGIDEQNVQGGNKP